jgi:phosphorylcholine metabolism protein LicD
MAGKYTLDGKNADDALIMLEKVTTFLESLGVEYWLEGGTLLGVIREDRLLPWDNDIDISISEEYYDVLLQALPELKRLGYMVWSKRFDYNDFPLSKEYVRMVKLRTRKFYFIRGEVGLDIFIKFKKEDNYYWQVGKKIKLAPAHFYDNLISYTFNGKEYRIPKDYHGYLTYRYGEWKKPVKEWNTFRDDYALKEERIER